MSYYTRNKEVCNWICENLRTWARNHVNVGFLSIAKRVAVNEVIRNTIAGRRVNSTSQLTIEKAGVVCYDKKD